MNILISLLKTYDLMHGGIDDFSEVTLQRNKRAVSVSEYGDEIIATGKLSKLGEVVFKKCLCFMRGDVRVEVKCRKHANEQGTWVLLLYQGFKLVLYKSSELIESKGTANVNV